MQSPDCSTTLNGPHWRSVFLWRSARCTFVDSISVNQHRSDQGLLSHAIFASLGVEKYCMKTMPPMVMMVPAIFLISAESLKTSTPKITENTGLNKDSGMILPIA